MNRKKVQARRTVLISLILALLVFFILQASSAYSVRATVAVMPSPQAASEPLHDQLVIARATVSSTSEKTRLESASLRILGEINNQVFIQTTFAELKRLQEAGWLLTPLYVRSAGADGVWRAAANAPADCTGSISPDHQSFPAASGFSSFNFVTDPDCEWTILTDVPWIHVSGVLQGTGSKTVSYTIDANNTGAARSGHIFIGGQVYTVFQGRNFDDVPSDHPFFTEIAKLSARGITTGCGGNNFCPNDPVTREQMAAFIVRALGEFNPPTPATQRFSDVPPSNPFYNFIDRLAALGITSGCSPTMYCPSRLLRREEAAAMIIRALGEFNPPTPATQRFNDVPPSNAFYNYIDRMAALGITRGCSTSPPLFCPGDTVTRGQMAVFLVRAFNL